MGTVAPEARRSSYRRQLWQRGIKPKIGRQSWHARLDYLTLKLEYWPAL